MAVTPYKVLRKSMRTLKSLLLYMCLLIPIAIILGDRIIGPNAPKADTRSSNLIENSIETGPASIRRSPRFITIQIRNPHGTLIAGETGILELEARLNQPQGEQSASPHWDGTATSPLLVWISSSDGSGITFINKLQPDRPRHHILVKFAPSEGLNASPLTSQVEYRINKRTKSGKHAFWLDVFGRLQLANGQSVRDMGIMQLPVNVDTHLKTKLLMLSVILVAIFLFIVEWVRVDVVAMAMMVVLPELGLLNAQDTFKGLSSNAVIAIIGVMILSYGLNRAGIVNRIIQPMLKWVGSSSHRLVVIFSSLIAVISSVMQNTGAAVLFLPAIRIVTSYRLKLPMSRVLMPIGMAAILGGTMTMIGTSPLILLNDILPPDIPKFSFLELTPIGIALVIGGIVYLSIVGMKILATHTGNPVIGGDNESKAVDEGILGSYRLIKGPYEIVIPTEYKSGLLPQTVTQIHRQFLVNIVATANPEGVCEIAPLPEDTIHPGLILCAYGPVKAVQRFVKHYGLTLRDEPQCFKANMFNPSLTGIVESVVSPRSSLIGKTIRDVRFRETFGLNVLAIHQSGTTYYRQLADRPLQAGDALLLNGTWEQLHTLEDFHARSVQRI